MVSGFIRPLHKGWAPIEEAWLNPENSAASEGGIIEKAA
jgi:hypothetical protein